MAYSNDFSRLIKKIENNLGLIPLTPHLPKEYNKEAWLEIIKDQSLVTFSRFFPHKISYPITTETAKKKGDRYFIDDEEFFGGARLLGILDIDWDSFGKQGGNHPEAGNYGYANTTGAFSLNFDQIIGTQLMANINSVYNSGIYIQQFDPNQFEIRNCYNSPVNLSNFPVFVIVEHTNLSTISATMMETFEDLAMADVAKFLFRNLRYWDGLATIYADVDLKLGELETEAGKRDEIIKLLDESSVSSANETTPIMITIS